MSNYTPTTPELGIQPIAVTSTTKNHPLGYKVGAYDATLGGGEFLYLEGVANTVVGSLVVYDQVGGTTTLAPNTAHLAEPVAVAMSANVASQYGWYQVQGAAVIKKTATIAATGAPIFLSGTAGRIMTSAASGKEILNARTVASVSAGVSTVTVQLAWPFAQGQVI